jgi:hypothetical protein
MKLHHVFKGLLLVSLLMGSGCNRQQSEKLPQGRAQETLQFWEAFNKAAVSGIGEEVLNQPVWHALDNQDMCEVLENIAAGEQARSRAITSLPVLHVDPDLAAYAIHFASSRDDLAEALRGYVALAKKQEEITSAPALGVGLLLNLLNHYDDKKDGILWRAILDEAKQTAGDVQKLREPANIAEAKGLAVRGAIKRLNTEEMEVRVKLAQRFDREIPLRETYLSAAYSARGLKHFSNDQVMQMLIGSKIGNWTFESGEFVSFKITNVTNRTEVLADYEVRTHVKGKSGQEHDFKLRVTYGREYTRWKLIEIQQL